MLPEEGLVPLPQRRVLGGFGFKVVWEFPKIRATLFWGPYHKDPTI